MDQRIIDLYDGFTHGGMSRRVFMERLTGLAGSASAAVALLPFLQNNYAQAAAVAPDDPRLVSETITYESPVAKVSAYLVRPKAKAKRPAIIVIHENRGLNPHIPDMARRLALEGFLVLAPDLLSVTGGTPADEEQARILHTKTKRDDMIAEAVAAVPFFKNHPESNGKIGAVGFCFGGGVINRMATDNPELDAVVVYYGDQPPAARIPGIHASLLLHYAELDQRINAGISAYEAALKENNKRYTIYMYPKVNHAFNNDTNAARYDKAAADLAWTRTLAFFKQNLGTPPSAA